MQKRTFDLTKDIKNVSERLTQILELGAPGSTIKLPAAEIELPNLLIKKPFTILGQAGTVLYFKFSQLVLDTGSEQRDSLSFLH